MLVLLVRVDFKALPKDQQRARIVDVLERGLVGKRMHVDLPKGLYGEWVHNSKEEDLQNGISLAMLSTTSMQLVVLCILKAITSQS
jgi:hypothetical protein